MKAQLKFSKEIELIPFRIEGKNAYVNYYQDEIQAGFPSPAEDFVEQKLSLDEKYLSHPDSTFLVRVKGNSMYPTLLEKDILVVRSDLELINNKIAIVSINKLAFTVKRIDLKNKQLIPDNEDYTKITINEDDSLKYLGVVVAVFRDL